MHVWVGVFTLPAYKCDETALGSYVCVCGAYPNEVMAWPGIVSALPCTPPPVSICTQCRLHSLYTRIMSRCYPSILTPSLKSHDACTHHTWNALLSFSPFFSLSMNSKILSLPMMIRSLVSLSLSHSRDSVFPAHMPTPVTEFTSSVHYFSLTPSFSLWLSSRALWIINLIVSTAAFSLNLVHTNTLHLYIFKTINGESDTAPLPCIRRPRCCNCLDDEDAAAAADDDDDESDEAGPVDDDNNSLGCQIFLTSVYKMQRRTQHRWRKPRL